MRERKGVAFRFMEHGVIYAQMDACACSGYEPCFDWSCDKELVWMGDPDGAAAILWDFSEIDRQVDL